MKRSPLFVLIAMLCLIIMGCFEEWKPRVSIHSVLNSGGTTAQIYGKIYDTNGNPCFGSVTLTKGLVKLRPEVISDLEGNFKINDVEPGKNYKLIIVVSNWVESYPVIKSLDLEAGQVITLEIYGAKKPNSTGPAV